MLRSRYFIKRIRLLYPQLLPMSAVFLVLALAKTAAAAAVVLYTLLYYWMVGPPAGAAGAAE